MREERQHLRFFLRGKGGLRKEGNMQEREFDTDEIHLIL